MLCCLFCRKYVVSPEKEKGLSNFVKHIERHIAKKPELLEQYPTLFVHPVVRNTLRAGWMKCDHCPFKTKHKVPFGTCSTSPIFSLTFLPRKFLRRNIFLTNIDFVENSLFFSLFFIIFFQRNSSLSKIPLQKYLFEEFFAKKCGSI